MATASAVVPQPATATARPAPGCHRHLRVVAYRAGGGTVRLPGRAQPPLSCAAPTGYATSESTIAVAGNEALIYSPARTENSMARSTNAGRTWGLTYPRTEQPTSFWNTVDPDVVADRRTGWVFWSHATGPVRNEGSLPTIPGLPQGSGFYLAAAQGFQVYSSSDNGSSWTTADYSTAPTGDWEKVFVGPPAPGSPQPRGYPDVVYLCANSPLEVSGPGRLCYRSMDGGRTFSIAGYVSPSATEPQDVCPPLNFNTGVVDRRGTIYQPVDCQSSAYIVVSHDEGSTYKWIPMPTAPTGSSTSGTNLKLAVDDAGSLYAVWTADGRVYMAVSTNHARTWRKPLMVAAPSVHDVELPAIAAGAPGHVGIVYYGTTRRSARMLTAYITQTADATDRRPLFYGGPINNPAHPIFHDYGLSDYPRTDFIGAAFDRAGTTFWAGAVKQFGPPDSHEYVRTTGWVGRLLWRPATPARVSGRR
ncbi:MAG: sialidase family protein [Solirubrobacteraceae bacterium]